MPFGSEMNNIYIVITAKVFIGLLVFNSTYKESVGDLIKAIE